MSEVRKFVLYITKGNYKAITRLLRVDGRRFKGLLSVNTQQGYTDTTAKQTHRCWQSYQQIIQGQSQVQRYETFDKQQKCRTSDRWHLYSLVHRLSPQKQDEERQDDHKLGAN